MDPASSRLDSPGNIKTGRCADFPFVVLKDQALATPETERALIAYCRSQQAHFTLKVWHGLER
jgi:hypothetical protein